MARVLEIGTRKYTEVIELEKCKSGAGCLYEIGTVPVEGSREVFANIRFQNGPIKENGTNGCHNEDLIAIVIDRLCAFQMGEFACEENDMALRCLEEAMMWLNKRTADRVARGVEGTNEV